MNTQPITPETLSSSVVAVPPLARRSDLTLDREQNQKLVGYLEAGGVSTLLYGGNAIFYHIRLSEFAETLALISDIVADGTLVIPSVGPAYGMMMDQAAVLQDFSFPTAMILPQKEVSTSSGIATAVRHFVASFGSPAVLYIKHDRYMESADVERLMSDGLLSWIKYAVVREDPAEDDYLKEIIDHVGPSRIVSGIGEQPAIIHMRDFQLASFTSGCVCAAPRLSMEMLAANRSADWERAETIRQVFRPLEDLRNGIHPIRVLHAAMALANIADMGPLLPLLSEVEEGRLAEIRIAASQLAAADSTTVTQ